MSITRIKIQSSGTSGNTPQSLLPGELAINFADGKIFYLNQSGGKSYVQNSNSFSTVIANGTSLFAATPTSILAVNPDASNTIAFTANTETDTITLGVNENNITSFVRKSGDTMTGNLHVDTANIYANGVTSNTVNTSDIYSQNGSSHISLSDIGIVSISPVPGTDVKVTSSGLEVNGSVYGGTYSGNRLDLNNQTSLISNRYDTVTIGTGTTGNVNNTWTFANSNLIFPDNTIQTTAWNGANTVIISNTTSSLSNTDGALTVVGGVGIGGNLNVGGAITSPTIQAIDEYANAAFATANAAYAFANSAVMEVAVVDEPYTANGSSNTFFINFTDRTNATVNSVFTNVDVLTYVPQTGTLSSNVITANTVVVSNISSISSGTVNLVNLYPSIVDRLDVQSFRSSSYHFQIENGLDSHMINMNVLNGDSLATFTFYGETFTYDSLGVFSANVSSGMVNVLFTPHYAPMTVSFMRRSLNRLGIVYPPVDLGMVFNATTNVLDLGYIFLSPDHIVDYGTLADQLSYSPEFDYQPINGTVDSGTF